MGKAIGDMVTVTVAGCVVGLVCAAFGQRARVAVDAAFSRGNPYRAGYAAGHAAGFEAGFREGRRVARPVAVPGGRRWTDR